VPQPVETPLEVLPVLPLSEINPDPEIVTVPLQEQAHEFIEVCKDVREVAGEKTQRVADWFRRQTDPEESSSGSYELAASTLPYSPPPDAEPVTPPAEPTPPRRSLAEMLAAFMQESNMVWGEILAGLVMVGSSVALVISLWTTLEQTVPYFPFLIFSAITAAIFGAGFYSLNHWKLEATSRGLLTIATLLVPLNFLVMAGLLVQHGVPELGLDLFRLASEITAIGVFVWLLRKTGKVLVPGGHWPMALAIVGISASVLSFPRLLTPDNSELWRSLLAGTLPVACFVAVGVVMVRRTLPADEIQPTKALLTYLGVTSFPLILVLGFLAYWSREIGLDIREAFERLSILLAIAASPLLAGGFRIHRNVLTPTSSDTALLRTAGTAVGFCGMAIMLAAVPLAWPSVWSTSLVCAFNFAVLTSLAFWLELPLIHVAALSCLTVGYLVAFNQLPFGGTTAESVQLFPQPFTTRIALGLCSLTALLTVAGELLAPSRKADAIFYSASAMVLAIVGLASANMLGLEHPGEAALLVSLYAAGGLAGNARWRGAAIDFVAVGLIPLATFWAAYWNFGGNTPFTGLALAFESLAFALIAVLGRDALRTPRAWRFTTFAVVIAALGCTALTWRQAPTHLPTIVLAITASTILTLTCLYDLVALTWFGAGLLLASVLHFATWRWPQAYSGGYYCAAMLLHASVAALISAGLRYRYSAPGRITRLYTLPLQWIALTTSALAPFALLLLPEGNLTVLAGFTGWIAIIWLVVACLAESPLLFLAAQVAAYWFVFIATLDWSRPHLGLVRGIADCFTLDRLQAFAIAMGLLCLFWMTARTLCRGMPRVHKLLNPPLPALDWFILGVLVLGACSVTIAGLLPGLARGLDLVGNQPLLPRPITGSGAWLLLGILATTLTIGMRERWQPAALLGLVIVLVTSGLTWAGSIGTGSLAVRAICWSLAYSFLLASAASWFRSNLLALGEGGKFGALLTQSHWRLASALTLGLTVIPIAAIAILILITSLAHWDRIDLRNAHHLVYVRGAGSVILSLGMILVGLIGHSIRERSPGYAFSAGFILNLIGASWFVHWSTQAGQKIVSPDWILLIQIVTMSASVWSMVAVASQRWLSIWREENNASARPLLSLQIFQAIIGNGLLLIGGIVAVLTGVGPRPGYAASIGSFLGWTVFVVTVAAIVWRAHRAGRFAVPAALPLVGHASIVLFACTIAPWSELGAFRTLMLGWACFLPALVALACMVERGGERAGILRAALRPEVVGPWLWTTAAAVVALSLASLAGDDEGVWAAAAIAVAGSSAAAMAVWRQREHWAFVAGLSLNLAISVLVCQTPTTLSTDAWILQFLQLNTMVAAVVALIWIGARRYLYPAGNTLWRSAPLLLGQIVATFALTCLLLLGPLLHLFTFPANPLPDFFANFTGPLGWATLLLPAWAACWYASVDGRRARGHLLLMTGLLVGVLASLNLGLRSPDQGWVAYHTLLAMWTGLGIFMVSAEPAARLTQHESTSFSPFPYLASLLVFSVDQFRIWTYVLGSLVLILAMRVASIDPQAPYWTCGVTGAVACMAGAIAIRSRSQEHVYLSGFLLALAGFFAWMAWTPASELPPFVTAYSLGYTLMAGLALGSALWSLIEFTLRSGTPAIDLRHADMPPFAHAGSWLAAIIGFVLLGVSLLGGFHFRGPPVHWLLPVSALVLLLFAFLTQLWDEAAPVSLAGLYATVFLMLGLTLELISLTPSHALLASTLGLGVFVLAATSLGEVVPRAADLWQALRIKQHPRWPEPWFLVTQYALGVVLVGSSCWIALAMDNLDQRLFGPATIALLLLSCVVAARSAPSGSAELSRSSTLWLGVVLAVDFAWALQGQPDFASALHRHTTLLLAFATVTFFESVVLRRLLRSKPGWLEATDRSGPVLLSTTLFVLIGLLGHEVLFFDRVSKHTPLVLWETLTVAVAFVGLMTTAICFAVDPARDIFRVSERQRPRYVYLAELLLLLLFVHIRLNVPELFGGVLTKYWPIVVMLIAFVGVGLSEFFERRGLHVLSGPLQRTGIFMPLLPLLAFWIRPPEVVHEFLVNRFPALHPALDGLMKLEPDFGRYAVIWFLLGLLYSWIANIKGSFRFGLFAALSGNFGLWALLFKADLSFFSHPQLWMIPLALIFLVSEHINRQELGRTRSNALRYLALTMIYVSSTADMFLAWGENPYLPIVLALLCVTGVLAGILLRVTAFLYLGTSFLCVVVFSMIWHAAVDHRQMWLWWASGIALGALIFALFAIFEKRRDDVIKLIENIKTWE
jgi:hypothetical protein